MSQTAEHSLSRATTTLNLLWKNSIAIYLHVILFAPVVQIVLNNKLSVHLMADNN